ncbi:hypothetical protein [Dyadobacter arcticus]|uniref:Uncharacterized protein n=1 Tax=Dyadobacter arcticus TaxID=1078754 RepID=A0ABX0UHG3_9BACT|nr:hypothetical protein [Dyadobacter arcticus]NIJ52362.1 hypothetical protein [Dyadobacter arcticus]
MKKADQIVTSYGASLENVSECSPLLIVRFHMDMDQYLVISFLNGEDPLTGIYNLMYGLLKNGFRVSTLYLQAEPELINS